MTEIKKEEISGLQTDKTLKFKKLIGSTIMKATRALMVSRRIARKTGDVDWNHAFDDKT